MIIEIAFEIKDEPDLAALECHLHQLDRVPLDCRVHTTRWPFVTKHATENITIEEMENRYTMIAVQRTQQVEEIRKIRSAYLDKYDGGPPWKGEKGFTAYIFWLENELAKARTGK